MKQSLWLCLLLSLCTLSFSWSMAPAFAQEAGGNSDLDFEEDGSGDEFGAEDFNPPPPPPPASKEQQSTAEEVQELSLDPGGGDVELPKPEVTDSAQEDRKKIDEINSKLKDRKKSKPPAKASKKGGEMKTTKSNCQMRAKASTKAKSVTMVKKGSKVWAENHNAEWVKVFRKKGHAFMSKSCF